jgi:N-acetylneuraminate synthase
MLRSVKDGRKSVKIKIGNKTLGEKPYVIAEFGVNHNGSFERAIEGIRKAAQAGADAIKFQTYTADELVVKGTPKFWEFEDDKDKNQHDAYSELGGEPKEWYPKLIEECNKQGIEFLTTCFSKETADYFNELGMKAFKVASSDMSTLPYLRHIARYGKPILLSTGASTMEEIEEAVDAIEDEGNSQIVIMHCTLCYPTMYADKDVHYEDANLNIIKTLKEKYPQYVIGISDHTQTPFSSIIAYTMGADVVEKHYTVDKTLGKSADHWFSVDPLELMVMVNGMSAVDILRGQSKKKVFDCEKDTRLYDKRSIVSATSIPKGTIIQEEMLTYKRPGTGIYPKFYKIIVGKKALEDIPADTILSWSMLSS